MPVSPMAMSACADTWSAGGRGSIGRGRGHTGIDEDDAVGRVGRVGDDPRAAALPHVQASICLRETGIPLDTSVSTMFIPLFPPPEGASAGAAIMPRADPRPEGKSQASHASKLGRQATRWELSRDDTITLLVRPPHATPGTNECGPADAVPNETDEGRGADPAPGGRLRSRARIRLRLRLRLRWRRA